MQGLKDKTFTTLRGGGCAVSIESQNTQKISKSDTQDIEMFITRFDSKVNTICSKASVAANQQESEEIMIAIQWFIFQEELIYQLIKDAQKVLKTYNLIIDGIRRLLKSCLIYIRTDQFKCFYILQITSSLSKVIFSFHIMKDQRFIEEDLQKEILDLSDELKQQMQIEKNDLIQVQMELYLFLTRTSFEIAPNNSKEREEILKGCLSGIISSITQMKPSAQLLESLFRGACLLYKMHSINKIKIQYETYFQIDMLQWEIVSYFKQETQNNLEEVLSKIEAIHENLVKNSNNWINHFLWIQMIGKILIYNPLITKQKLFRLASSYNLDYNSSQMWKEYQKKGLIIQMNHSKDQAVIQLSQLQKKQIPQLDRIMLEEFFKQPIQFTLLKDFLLNEQNQNIHFTFKSYLQNKLQIGDDNQENENSLAASKIQNFFDLIIPNKLLTLITENYEKLGVVQETYRNFMEKNTKFNEKIQQTVYNSQFNKMILNLKEYFQNNQNIIKILRLNSRKGNDMIKQHEVLNELSNCQQLKYLMKVIEQTLQSLIQEFKNKSDNQNSDKKNYETNETVEIQKELTNINFKNTQLDDLRKKLLALLADSLNQKTLLRAASNLIQLISNSWKELEKLEKLEISSLQDSNLLIEFIENQLNYNYKDYKQLSQEIQRDNNETMLLFKKIIQIKYEFEAFNNYENLRGIELVKPIQHLRFRYLKLHSKLDNIKKSLTNLFSQANQQELKQLQELVNLDGFLLSVVKDYPIKTITTSSDINKLIIAELKSTQFTKEDYQNKLSNLKGSIEYLQFYISLEEQMISTEESDLQLIEESTTQMLAEKIIQASFVEELLKYMSDENFKLSELIKEKVKFENYLSELTKIKYSSKYQNMDQVEIDYFSQLAIQIERVIKTMNQFETLDNEIFLILIKQALMTLLKIIKEKDKNIIHKQANQKEEIQQIGKSLDIQNQIEFNFVSNENGNTYLSFMNKVLKLQSLKLKQEKELLHKLLEETVTFSDNLNQILIFEEEIQIKCFQIFQLRIQQFITNFGQLAITHINLKSQKDENFNIYFERISFNLFKGQNNTDITQTQTDIQEFLNSLKVYFQEKQGLETYFNNTRINQEFMIQQIRKLYLMDNQEDYDKQSHQKLSLFDALNQKLQDFNSNQEWKIKQGLVFTIIQISSNCFTYTVISFCQKTLIQLWGLLLKLSFQYVDQLAAVAEFGLGGFPSISLGWTAGNAGKPVPPEEDLQVCPSLLRCDSSKLYSVVKNSRRLRLAAWVGRTHKREFLLVWMKQALTSSTPFQTKRIQK